MPKCILCNKDAEFDVPTDLCEEHWQAWFDYKITEEELQDKLQTVDWHGEEADKIRKLIEANK
ncbi:MAG: hypothetical protein ACXAC5_03690 [Promethearchaeota archaeon]|jgi:hypothetical protein